MAAITSGWRWPREFTAIPEPKSRNTLPSASSTYTPSPFTPTSGELRLREGESISESWRIHSRALGPGGVTTIFGAVYGMPHWGTRRPALSMRETRSCS